MGNPLADPPPGPSLTPVNSSVFFACGMPSGGWVGGGPPTPCGSTPHPHSLSYTSWVPPAHPPVGPQRRVAATLASSLYLLWLRLAARDYGTAAQLVDCIGTDVEFSPEERQTFVSLGDLVDGHPNATSPGPNIAEPNDGSCATDCGCHREVGERALDWGGSRTWDLATHRGPRESPMAIRTKVSHVVLESPLVTPWYMPDELADTFAAASHLSPQGPPWSCRGVPSRSVQDNVHSIVFLGGAAFPLCVFDKCCMHTHHVCWDVAGTGALLLCYGSLWV